MSHTSDLHAGGHRYTVERATSQDLPAIVALLSDDPLGSQRESSDLAQYLRAFEIIDSDPHQFLVAAKNASSKVVGTMQLTLIPGLSRHAATRLHIEAVRVASEERGSGLGSALFAWAHDYGRANGAVLAELTTDRSRTGAHRFYDRLGYTPSHVGFKMNLDA